MMKKLISWVEIPATDFYRAVEFYNKVLQIELEPLDFGSEKMACLPGDEGAISLAPGFKPSTNGPIISLNAENDIDGMISRVTENGGSITRNKTKIEAEGRGYFALFIDTEGNRLGIYGN